MFGDRSRIRKEAIVENGAAMLPSGVGGDGAWSSFNFFDSFFYHFLCFFLIVFIILNMFLHLAHIYANSFNLILLLT